MTKEFSKIEVTFNNEVNAEQIKKLCSNFDWYPEAIDDGTQYKNALANNEKIYKELPELGVTKAVIRGYMSMAGTVYDKFLIGEKDANL